MNFLGNPPGSGVTPEQEEKLDAINVEPSGEVKFNNGIIVAGTATELKTTITEVDDPILQINRANNSVTSGITIKNVDDGKYSSIIRSGTDYWFTKDTMTDDALAPTANERANIICGDVNSVNVGQLNADFDLHRLETSIHAQLDDNSVLNDTVWSSQKISQELKANADQSDLVLNDWITNNFDPHTNDLSIHRPLDDLQTTNTNLWSASKIASEITAGATVIDDITPAVDKVYSSSKTQNIVDTVQNNLTTHTTNLNIHRPVSDGLISTTSLWSSQKTANEIQNVNTALGFHVSNNAIHAELNDGLQTNTNLWSASKIASEITAGATVIDDITPAVDKVYSSSKTQNIVDTVQTNLTNLETSATRALIQDTSSETKIELSQPQISLTSAETKIKGYDVIPGTVQYEWDPVTNVNTILSNSNTLSTCPLVAGLAEARVRNSDAFVVGNEVKTYRMSFESVIGNYIQAGIVRSSHPFDAGNPNRSTNRWWLFRNNTAFTAVGCNGVGDLSGSNVNNADGDVFEFKVDLLGTVTVEKLPPFVIGDWDYNGGGLFTYPTQLTVGQEYRFFIADNDPNADETGAVQLQPVPTAVPVLTPIDVVTIGNNLVDITGDLKISGDLLVSGTTTTVNTDNITIEDPLIKLANQNNTNVVNIGFIGQYNDGVPKFCGLIQTYNNNNWHLIGGTTQVPDENVVPAYINTELGTLNLNQAILTQVLPYIPAQGIRLTNGTEEIKVGNSSIDFTDTAFNVNSVQQDTKVSAYGQFYIDFSLTNPFTTLLNSGYATAFPIPPSNATGLNVGFNSGTNTFTIQHAGLYRFSYHISVRNVDNDNTFIQVSLQKNGIQNDAFELSSMTRHLRQRNRVTTLSTSFIHEMALNDTVRMYLEAFLDTGAGGNENIDVFDVNVNVERLRTNF